jgi:transketolase
MSFNISFPDTTYENKQRSIEEFFEISLELRRDVIKSLFLAKSGHSGGSLGTADIFAVLFFGGFLNYDSSNWKIPNRDRFILSVGHIAPILYASLARAGFFEPSELATLRKLGSRLQGHPGLDVNLPGIETSSGSLGQGVSIAVGMALSQKYLDKTENLTFTMTGDGELEEGSVWEAAMAASNYKLSNLCWIVDNNDCQIDGRVSDVMNIYPLQEKFEAFGFDVVTIDGHNYSEIIEAFTKFKNNAKNSNKPTCIIAKTYMGRGISFMEDDYSWHGVPPNEEQAIKALEELDKLDAELKKSNKLN